MISRKIYILLFLSLNAAALLLHSCTSYDVAPRYTDKYIASGTGNLTAQVPEAYELGYAVLALTDLAQKDTSLIDKSTPYYKEFTAYFAKYKNHKAVVQLNQSLVTYPKLFKSYRNGLYAFKMFDDRLVLKDNYRIDVNKMKFSRYQRLLQNFYSVTKFHKFYNAHENVYKQLVKRSDNFLSFDIAQKIISKDSKSFQVVLSPLTKGYPATMEIKSKGFVESIIFPYVDNNGLVYGEKSDEIIR